MYKDIFTLETETIFVKQKGDISIKDSSSKKTKPIKELSEMESCRLLRKCFHKWRDNIKNTKDIMNVDQMQKTKINEFINNLKNRQMFFHLHTQYEPSKGPKALKPNEEFKNRYKVQSTIIDLQKEKIKEQDKIIDELKLGIIREDVLKSIENNKNIIREIFGNCSGKLLFEAPLIKAVEEREKIMITAQKVPKIVQKIQQRTIEREKYRKAILERKQIKEEAKQKLLKEIIEKKKFLEEEERKKNLEIINEQRRQELKLQKIRQQKRQQFEQRNLMAANFYNKLLIKQCFKKLFNFYSKSKENVFLAASVYAHKKKRKIFKAWLGCIEAKCSIKNNIADAHFGYKILKQSMTCWKKFQLESVRALQVAEDVYDFRLTSNIFIHWHRYVCKEIMIQLKKNHMAIKHNNRRLLFQYFHQWMYLPAVIKLEKSKEETKRKWREKVWEILPDYQPSELF